MNQQEAITRFVNYLEYSQFNSKGDNIEGGFPNIKFIMRDGSLRFYYTMSVFQYIINREIFH